MSGIQEILVVVGIVLAILIVPRMTARKPLPRPVKPVLVMTGKMRLAIAASLIYPALVAAYLQPWKGGQADFLYIGLGPVAVCWLIFWVKTGFPGKR